MENVSDTKKLQFKVFGQKLLLSDSVNSSPKNMKAY